jgi:alkylation response protein AidB-like acyl-CoA dehydrogenase
VSTTKAIEKLIERVTNAADEIESGSGIPADLSGDLKRAGLFSLLLPSSLDGPEMAFPEFLSLVRQFAYADGSVAWCINQGSVLAALAHHFDQDAAREIWSDPSITVANGPPAGCTVEHSGQGYRLSGRWSFSSGIEQADFLIGMATLKGARPKGLWCFFPRDDADIDESWQVSGLRGTASYSFSVEDLHIPERFAVTQSPRVDAPHLYRIPMNLMFACGFASVAIGVSRAALDFAIERAKTKVKRFDRVAMSAHGTVRRELGVAEAEWRSAEALLDRAVGEVWSIIDRGLELDDRMKLRTASTHTIRVCKTVTDRVYDLCSTDSIFRHNDIQRRFQDIHVISQHLQGRPEIYELVGSFLLGTELDRTMIS